jgi:glycosyltransferase involved in cell wall biosynthesis
VAGSGGATQVLSTYPTQTRRAARPPRSTPIHYYGPPSWHYATSLLARTPHEYHASPPRPWKLGARRRSHALDVTYPGSAVVTVHDLGPWLAPGPKRLYERVTGWAAKRSLRAADVIIGVSEKSRVDAEAFGFRVDRVIHPVLREDLARIPPRSVPRHGWLLVGNMNPRKAYQAAFTVLPAGAHVTWVGYSTPDADWQRYEEALLRRADLVDLLLERRSDETVADLAQAYDSARGLIVTGTWEGYCLPVMEALSRGCPVVFAGPGPRSWATMIYGDEIPHVEGKGELGDATDYDARRVFDDFDEYYGWTDYERFVAEHEAVYAEAGL